MTRKSKIAAGAVAGYVVASWINTRVDVPGVASYDGNRPIGVALQPNAFNLALAGLGVGLAWAFIA